MNSILQKLYTTNNPYKAFVAFSAYTYQVGSLLIFSRYLVISQY